MGTCIYFELTGGLCHFEFCDREMRPLDYTLLIAILVSDSLLTESILRDYIVRVGHNDMVSGLIPLDIYDFNERIRI